MTNIQYSEKAVVAASEAQALLRRVIEDHPTTPWALLAERELKDPLGFKWVETYVQPRPRGNDNAAAARKNKPGQHGQAAGDAQAIIEQQTDGRRIERKSDRVETSFEQSEMGKTQHGTPPSSFIFG